jgi:hypothetical protein
MRKNRNEKTYEEELHNLYSLPNNSLLRRQTRINEMRNEYKTPARTSKERERLGILGVDGRRILK